jgi:hypothetical protein
MKLTKHKRRLTNNKRKHKTLKNNKVHKRASRKNVRTSRHKTRTNKTRTNKNMKNKHKKRFRGGSSELSLPPFVPPGGAYKVGSNTNGLAGGYYYERVTPDFHAPNGTAKDSNAINVNGKPMKGGNIIPRDILNLYRTTGSNLIDVYNGYTGQRNNISTDPNPMRQPVASNNYQLDSSVVDLNDVAFKATHEASLV